MRLTLGVAGMAWVFAIRERRRGRRGSAGNAGSEELIGLPASTIAVPTRDIVDVIRELRNKLWFAKMPVIRQKLGRAPSGKC